MKIHNSLGKDVNKRLINIVGAVVLENKCNNEIDYDLERKKNPRIVISDSCKNILIKS